MLFSLFIKAKSIRKREFILSSPHPALSIRRGLQSGTPHFTLSNYKRLSIMIFSLALLFMKQNDF